LRVIFALQAKDSTATWEVPFGSLDRTFDNSKVNYGRTTIDTQEYGALHWVRKELGDDRGVAVLNKGLPCARYVSGTLDISLLRSPEACLSANMPMHYEFWDLDGQRDTGKHRLEYAMLPYWDGLATGDLVRRGYAYNAPAAMNLPFEVEGDVVVTAWKPAENGDGFVLRLQDAGGKGTEVTISFDRQRQVTRTNLLEQPQAEPERLQVYKAPIHRHGILTLLVR